MKPAFEPICVAYKPGAPRALQIDECKIPADTANARRHKQGGTSPGYRGGFATVDRAWGGAGRWPANVCHDGSDEVMAAFAAFGEHRSGEPHECLESRARQSGFHMTAGCRGYGDTGTAARFFYCAKAGKADRAGSKHPTVKPVALMRWLVRLVTPPGGVVLDPFAGSGTTGAAALADGRRAILIEREPEYLDDIRRRLNGDKAPAPARRRSAAQPAVCGVL